MLPLSAAHAQSSSPDAVRPAQNTSALPNAPSKYRPITGEERMKWLVYATVGPKSLTGGLFSSAIGTAADRPEEYGTHWVGFGQRYGMRLTGVSTGNVMQAAFGAMWGEDPRYFPVEHEPFKSRVKNVIDLTFRAYHRDGERYPAYARLIGTFGNNFLSNTWRVESEANVEHAMIRSAEGIGSHMLSNAVSEFVPQLWRKIRHKPESASAGAAP